MQRIHALLANKGSATSPSTFLATVVVTVLAGLGVVELAPRHTDAPRS